MTRGHMPQPMAHIAIISLTHCHNYINPLGLTKYIQLTDHSTFDWLSAVAPINIGNDGSWNVNFGILVLCNFYNQFCTL